MRKQYLILVVVVLVAVSAFSLVACNINGDVVSGNKKPLASYYMSYEIENKEFSINENAEIRLLYGTSLNKAFFDSNPDMYVNEIFAISKEGEYQFAEANDAIAKARLNPNRLILHFIENFYEENYPMPIKNKDATSETIQLPQELFVGNNGHIIIVMPTGEGVEAKDIFYMRENTKITLMTKEEKLENQHGIQEEVIIQYEKGIK